MAEIFSFHRLRPDQLSFAFSDSRKNAALKSIHATLMDATSFEICERGFAEKLLSVWSCELDEEDRALCVREFERLGLIPTK